MNLTEGPSIQIDNSLVDKSMNDKMTGKALGLSGVISEMLRISSGVGYGLNTHIVH